MISLLVFVGLMVFMMGVGVALTLILHSEWCRRAPTPRSQPHKQRCVCAACYHTRLSASMEAAIHEQQQQQIAAAVEEASKL